MYFPDAILWKFVARFTGSFIPIIWRIRDTIFTLIFIEKKCANYSSPWWLRVFNLNSPLSFNFLSFCSGRFVNWFSTHESVRGLCTCVARWQSLKKCARIRQTFQWDKVVLPVKSATVFELIWHISWGSTNKRVQIKRTGMLLSFPGCVF